MGGYFDAPTGDLVLDRDVDPIVQKVLQRVSERSRAGMKRYGVSMMRDDMETVQWLRHAQEEALDFAVYIERVIYDLETSSRNVG